MALWWVIALSCVMALFGKIIMLKILDIVKYTLKVRNNDW